MRNTSVGKFCSFCGVTGDSGARLAGGLGTFICDECAAYHHAKFARGTDAAIFDAEEMADLDPEHQAKAGPWLAMSDVEVLAKLPLIADTGAQANDFLAEWVTMCRGRGLSWASVGQALGTTRQTAWERFSRRVEDIERQRAAG